MRLIPAKTPEFVKGLFPNFVWTLPSEDKVLYLSFDDGPIPEVTDWVLDTLASYKAKGTFFLIGSNVNKHVEIYNRIKKEGHSIGNHSYRHLNGWASKTKAYMRDIEKTEKILNQDISKSISKLFRPPYGKLKLKQAKQLQELGYKIVMWDVLSFDWSQNTTPEQCLGNVISKAKKGSIIVFHDSLKAERNLKYALPKVLDYFSHKGFSFKAIS